MLCLRFKTIAITNTSFCLVRPTEAIVGADECQEFRKLGRVLF